MHLKGRKISGVEVRQPRLRWPIPESVKHLEGHSIRGVSRRGKYILFDCGEGHLIVHLGMSGSLRVIAAGEAPGKHDHFDLGLGDIVLRLRDPRRFGAVLWTNENVTEHWLIRDLGIEPLAKQFNADRMHDLSRHRRTPVKQFLMDARHIVGIGNIYANESLFLAGIRPTLRAGRLTRLRNARLVAAIKATLRAAIRAGGSSLRDYVSTDGNPGYFQQRYSVYEREGAPCRACGATIRRIVLGQRSTYFCPACQR